MNDIVYELEGLGALLDDTDSGGHGRSKWQPVRRDYTRGNSAEQVWAEVMRESSAVIACHPTEIHLMASSQAG
jgi:hypothetical protein